MRRNIPAIFAISALIGLILCSACTFLPSEEKKEGGLTQVTIPVESSRISFGEAQQKLDEYRMDSVNETMMEKPSTPLSQKMWMNQEMPQAGSLE